MQALNPQQKNLPWSKFSGPPQTSMLERSISRLRETRCIKMLRQTQGEILQGFKEGGVR